VERRKKFGDLGGDLQPFTGQGLSGLVSRPSPTDMVVGTATKLSTDEALELERCETIIERGLKTFLEVGTALAQVRDLRLYRGEYDTFEAYCDERWGLKRQRAYELMDAANVVRQMSEISDIPAPERESHAAALAQLKDPAQQRQAWEVARQRAHDLGKRITAGLVQAVVREMVASPVPPASAGPSVDEPDDGPAPAQSAAVSDQSDEDDLFPDDESAPAAAVSSPPAAASAHADRQQIIVWVEEDQADEDDAAALTDAGEPWPDNLFEIEARLAEEGWERVSESETRISYRRGEEHLRLVKPPDPHVVQLRLVAHAGENMDHVMAWLQRQIGAEFSRKPAGSWLPRYPERRRVYGSVSTAQRSYVEDISPMDVAMLRGEVADLQRRLVAARTIIEEYQEHITRAQNYKPTSERGEAVSPLLRALERVWLELQEG